MKHHARVLPHRMSIDQWMCKTFTGDHPILVPAISGLLVLHLVKLLQRHKPGFTSFTNAMKVHGLVLEGLPLKSPINMPSSSPHAHASFPLIVGHSKNVWVRALGMFVESALDCSQLLGNLHLSFTAQSALALEHQDPIVFHVIFDPCHHLCRKGIASIQ